MAQSVRAADVDGLAHGVGAGALAGVAGARHVVIAHELERLREAARRVARLAAGEVEADDAALAAQGNGGSVAEDDADVLAEAGPADPTDPSTMTPPEVDEDDVEP